MRVKANLNGKNHVTTLKPLNPLKRTLENSSLLKFKVKGIFIRQGLRAVPLRLWRRGQVRSNKQKTKSFPNREASIKLNKQIAECICKINSYSLFPRMTLTKR